MNKYYALYRCELCNTNFRITDNMIELNEKDLPIVLGKIIQNQQFIGSMLYDAPITVPHRCPDGSAGLARLIGLKKYASDIGAKTTSKNFLSKFIK